MVGAGPTYQTAAYIHYQLHPLSITSIINYIHYQLLPLSITLLYLTYGCIDWRNDRPQILVP